MFKGYFVIYSFFPSVPLGVEIKEKLTYRWN